MAAPADERGEIPVKGDAEERDGAAVHIPPPPAAAAAAAAAVAGITGGIAAYWWRQLATSVSARSGPQFTTASQPHSDSSNDRVAGLRHAVWENTISAAGDAAATENNAPLKIFVSVSDPSARTTAPNSDRRSVQARVASARVRVLTMPSPSCRAVASMTAVDCRPARHKRLMGSAAGMAAMLCSRL